MRIESTDGIEVTADVAVVAPGIEWRRLAVDGIDELLGRGIYYGAGRSEAVGSAGKEVVIVGAGNSAGQAVMNFAEADARVTMVVRGDSLGKSMSAYLVQRIEHRDPLALETGVPGIFAAGDARHGSTKRVAAAVGEGAMAVALAERRLDELAPAER